MPAFGDDEGDRQPDSVAGLPLSNEPQPPQPENLISAPPLPLPPPPRVPAENPPWTLWDVLAIAVVTFGSITVIGGIGLLIAKHFYHVQISDLARNPKWAVPVEFFAYVITLAFMKAIVHSRGLPFWNTVRWRWVGGALKYPITGILLAFVVGLATSLLPIPKELPIEKYFADTLGSWILAIFGVTVAPFMEELFFRGFVYPALARPLGMRWSVGITSALFALIHCSQLAGAWAPLLLLFLVGVVLTTARVRTGSVVPGFLIHSAYNFTLFVELFIQTDHFHNFDKLGLIH